MLLDVLELVKVQDVGCQESQEVQVEITFYSAQVVEMLNAL
jgi:hypothetical protein